MSSDDSLVGLKFGNLTVISFNGRNNQYNSMWECVCDCGNNSVVRGSSLKNGHTQSCGCLDQKTKENRRHIEWEEKENGCWECTSHKPSYWGYPQYMVKQKNFKLHRYVYEVLFGEIPDDMVIMHKCDNRMCINPEHLQLGTQEENIQDMINKNRQARGERNGHAILTESAVRFIKENRKKIKGRILAKIFGVSPQTICGVFKGRAWAHIKI